MHKNVLLLFKNCKNHPTLRVCWNNPSQPPHIEKILATLLLDVDLFVFGPTLFSCHVAEVTGEEVSGTEAVAPKCYVGSIRNKAFSSDKT